MKRVGIVGFCFFMFLTALSAHGETSSYSIPLRFEVVGDAVELPPLILDYDLSSQTALKMGPDMEFSDITFSLIPTTLGRLDSHLNSILDEGVRQEKFLYVRWPRGFVGEGLLEAITRSGMTAWKYEISQGEMDSWKARLSQWRERLRQSGVDGKTLDAMPLFQGSFGVKNFDPTGTLFWTLQEPFRFCLTFSAQENLQTRLCTRYLEVARFKGGAMQFTTYPLSPAPARVIALGQDALLKDQKAIENKKAPVQFYAELKSGASYEFLAKPSSLNIVEIVALERDPQHARLVAWGPRPAQMVKDISREDLSFLEKLLGPFWYQTIGDMRQFWETLLPMDQPQMFIPGQGGGLFRQDFKIKRLPSERIRPYVHYQTVDGTYQDGVKVFGKKPARVKVRSKMNSAFMNNEGPNEFTWEFQARQRGEYNKSYLIVEDNGFPFRVYREIYKGYPGEISARMSGILGNGTIIFMGEAAFNYWFEDLFGWTQYYLSRQRWGFSAKYFQSLSAVPIGTMAETFTSQTLDLKYRLTPGLWGRDETWGAIMGYNSASYGAFSAKLSGFGLFWARSMPKVFDDLFNLLPYMKYPKWVDMELIYYTAVLNASDVRIYNLGSGLGNWALNFHGKVMWGKQFFGEAGFGIKQLDFDQASASGVGRQRIKFTSFYGTAGLGFSF